MTSSQAFRDKRITLIGLGARSGVAVAELLDDLGAHLVVSDLRPAEQLAPALEALRSRPIEFVLGGHPPTILDRADMVVVSPGVPWDAPILKLARERGLPVLGELEIAARLCRAPIVAVTGTKGKSTTTRAIGVLLQANPRFGRVLVGGNIGIALSRDVRSLTEHDIAVVEVSSFQLESIERFHPVVSVVTNLYPDHLDRHGSMEAYVAAKRRIFLNQTPQDWTVLNAEDERVRDLARHTRARIAWFGLRKEAFRYLPWHGVGGWIEDGRLIVASEEGQRSLGAVDRLPLVGRHNQLNLLAACVVGTLFQTPSEAMRERLSDLRPAPHTLEVVATHRGIRFVNDSKATNVAATQAALEAFAPPIVLIMGGYDKGNHYAPLVSLVRDKVRRLILLGPDTEKIHRALGHLTDTHRVGDMATAVRRAVEAAVPGTTVLLSPACASFDLFEDYRQRGEAFRREVVSLLLSRDGGSD